MPSTLSQPAEYPGVKELITFKPVTNDDRAEYFAKYTNMSLGRVKNLYLKWARLKGPLSPECQQLNRLFSQCVDGNRIKVPPSLEDPQEPPVDAEPFILDALHTAAKESIANAIKEDGNYEGYTLETLDILLNEDHVALSEYELIQLTIRWCDKNGRDFKELMHNFDYSKLSDEQQVWLLNRLPQSTEVQSLIRNGLLQSQLVEPIELRKFKLDHPSLHWRPIFDSSTDRMARFFDVACQSLEAFQKKLVILTVHERLTVMIYIPQKIEKASEVQVNGNVRVFALPHSSGISSPNYCVVPTKINYRLYCDESVLQLYENKRGNTWVSLNRGAMDDSSYRNIQREGERRRAKQESVEQEINFDCRASIALDKINKGIQTHVGRVRRVGVLGAVCFAGYASQRGLTLITICRRYMSSATETLELCAS